MKVKENKATALKTATLTKPYTDMRDAQMHSILNNGNFWITFRKRNWVSVFTGLNRFKTNV